MNFATLAILIIAVATVGVLYYSVNKLSQL
jgi:hypothetical protein